MTNIFEKNNHFEENKDVASVLKYGSVNDCPAPEVSIIIPCYKRPNTFRESLFSAIHQSFQGPYEIVVVDNYDGEGESPNFSIVKELSSKNVLYYHNEKNLGMYGNWNRGIELVRSDYFTFCHDDDILLPDCLSQLLRVQKYNGNKLILSSSNTINEEGLVIDEYGYPHIKRHFFKEKEWYDYTLYNQFIQSMGFGVGCLFNKECMMEIGGYNKEYYPSADYALHSCYTYYYGCVINSVPTFCYRRAYNESFTIWRSFAEMDKQFRFFMIEKINFNKNILRQIIRSNYRLSKNIFAEIWGTEEDIVSECTKRDKMIMSIASLSNRYKKYSFVGCH